MRAIGQVVRLALAAASGFCIGFLVRASVDGIVYWFGPGGLTGRTGHIYDTAIGVVIGLLLGWAVYFALTRGRGVTRGWVLVCFVVGVIAFLFFFAPLEARMGGVMPPTDYLRLALIAFSPAVAAALWWRFGAESDLRPLSNKGIERTAQALD